MVLLRFVTCATIAFALCVAEAILLEPWPGHHVVSAFKSAGSFPIGLCKEKRAFFRKAGTKSSIFRETVLPTPFALASAHAARRQEPVDQRHFPQSLG